MDAKKKLPVWLWISAGIVLALLIIGRLDVVYRYFACVFLTLNICYIDVYREKESSEMAEIALYLFRLLMIALIITAAETLVWLGDRGKMVAEIPTSFPVILALTRFLTPSPKQKESKP